MNARLDVDEVCAADGAMAAALAELTGALGGEHERDAADEPGGGDGTRGARTAETPRVDLNEENVARGLAQLVLTVMRLVHELLERQAIRRMDAGTLSDEEVERVGRTLKAQSEAIAETASRFGLTMEELNLDLGPLGRAL